MLRGFADDEVRVLAALVDVVIPADDAPGGWAGGVETLLRDHLEGFLAWCREPLHAAIAAAEVHARNSDHSGYADLSVERQRAIFEELAHGEGDEQPPSGDSFGGFRHDGVRPFDAVIVVAFEGYYGGTSEPAGWKVAGFQSLPDGVTPVETTLPTGVAPDQLAEHYEVVIIGAGAGGGVAAAELAEGGEHVLLIDRARPFADSELRGNHLQAKRLQTYDVTAGPGAGSPRVLEHDDGSTTLLPGDGSGGAYGLVAMALGGGTRLWQGMSWRFYPEDFRMADEYGVAEDSTLADWPFGYDELEPYYDRVEYELGVSGDGAGSLGIRTPRSRPYPMPPLPDDATRLHLGRAAASVGWTSTAIPFAINSVSRDGRAACVQCSQCIGNTCPVNAKAGTHNTFVPRALATGRADLLMHAQATGIEHTGGRASGVRVIVETVSGPVEKLIRADRIVVAAGALETPRLLLASGLGNEWVGRNHHSHGFVAAIAEDAPAGVKTYLGPGHSVATLDFVHRNREAWGGGVLFDLNPAYPLGRAIAGMTSSGHRYGTGHKEWMRASELPLGAMSMVQEIPHALTRITLDPGVRDRYGMPVVRAKGIAHAASIEATNYMALHAAAWIEAAGGRGIQTVAVPMTPQGTEHSAGTARLGSDPALAACDPRGKLFGTENVYVADASLHPTNGGFNPALTVMANAMRVSRLILGE